MVIDILFAVFALYGVYIGFKRGIIKTVFLLLSLLIGFMVAVRFSVYATDLLKQVFNTDNAMLFLAGFLLCFVLSVLIFRFIGKTLESVLDNLGMNAVNKAAGGIIVAAFFTFVFSILLWFGDRARLIPEQTKNTSMTYPYLQDFPDQVKTLVKKIEPFFTNTYDKGVETLDELERKAKKED